MTDDEAKYGMTSQEFTDAINTAMGKVRATLDNECNFATSVNISLELKTITLMAVLFSIFIEMYGKNDAAKKLHEKIDIFDKEAAMTKAFLQ